MSAVSRTRCTRTAALKLTDRKVAKYTLYNYMAYLPHVPQNAIPVPAPINVQTGFDLISLKLK